ncbi:MAG: hypothetical protein WDN03_17120 [Rhizomicrobium sp.]
MAKRRGGSFLRAFGDWRGWIVFVVGMTFVVLYFWGSCRYGALC